MQNTIYLHIPYIIGVKYDTETMQCVSFCPMQLSCEYSTSNTPYPTQHAQNTLRQQQKTFYLLSIWDLFITVRPCYGKIQVYYTQVTERENNRNLVRSSPDGMFARTVIYDLLPLCYNIASDISQYAC